jgi:hypothetical protein
MGHEPGGFHHRPSREEIVAQEERQRQVREENDKMQGCIFDPVVEIVRAKYPQGVTFQVFRDDAALMQQMAVALASGLKSINSLGEVAEERRREFVEKVGRGSLTQVFDTLKEKGILTARALHEETAQWAWEPLVGKFNGFLVKEMVFGGSSKPGEIMRVTSTKTRKLGV